MRPNSAILDNFYIAQNIFNGVTDAAYSTYHKKIWPTLGNGKFGFFGPLLPLLTYIEIKTHM